MDDQLWTNDRLLDLLYRSLDEPLTAAERAVLDKALQDRAWLNEEREQLLRLRQGLSDLRPAADPGFAAQVLRQLPRREAVVVQLRRSWPAVAAACALAVAVALGNIYIDEGELGTEAIIGFDELSVEDAYVIEDF